MKYIILVLHLFFFKNFFIRLMMIVLITCIRFLICHIFLENLLNLVGNLGVLCLLYVFFIDKID